MKAVGITVFALIGLTQSLESSAGELRNVIVDLYGGDGITLAVTPKPFSAGHIAHFTAESLEQLNNLSQSIASSVGQFAFNSAVSGFTFDVDRGMPVRSDESLGPILAERAVTLGKRRLNFSFSYTHVAYDQFEGQSLNHLTRSLGHIDCCGLNGGFSQGDGQLGPAGTRFAFELDQVQVSIDLTLKQDIFSFYGTYGLTDNWDVGVVIPLIRTEARAVAFATVVDNGGAGIHGFEGTTALGTPADRSFSSSGGVKTGFGDVVLRSKYKLLRAEDLWPDLAVVGQLTLPTGDKRNLLGKEETRFRLMTVASRRFDWLTPHMNVGYEMGTGEADADNLNYVAGFDAQLHRTLTVAVDVLGRFSPHENDIEKHLADVALATKWNPFGELAVNGYVILPINAEAGLRADAIWSVGLEYTF